MTRSRRITIWLLIAATAVLAGGGYGAARLARWQHHQTKLRRARQFRDIIWRHAQDKALATELVTAMIVAESGGDPAAVSRKNAKGLMQITPIAEREVLAKTGIAKGDLADPDYNILIGTTYLRMLLDRFDGDAHLALAAYHLGPTKVAKLGHQHPGLTGRQLIEKHAPRITADYCRRILGGQ